jgi:hypothetical protein
MKKNIFFLVMLASFLGTFPFLYVSEAGASDAFKADTSAPLIIAGTPATRQLDEREPREKEPRINPAKGKLANTNALSVNSPCVYEYEIEVWQIPAIFQGDPMDHTATRTKIFKRCGTTRSLYQTVDRCNHGSCPASDIWPNEASQGGFSPRKTTHAEPLTSGGLMQSKAPLSSSSSSDKMQLRETYAATIQTEQPLIPEGCDHFGYNFDPSIKGNWWEHYGITGERHVCNNDSFMEMGQIVTGKMPNKITAQRVCENQNFETYTEQDPKYRPTFKKVQDFVKEYGWEAATASVCPEGKFSTTGEHHRCVCAKGTKKYGGIGNSEAWCEGGAPCPEGKFSTTAKHRGCYCAKGTKKYGGVGDSEAWCEGGETCPNGKFSTTGRWRGCSCQEGMHKVYHGIFNDSAECARNAPTSTNVKPNSNVQPSGNRVTP